MEIPASGRGEHPSGQWHYVWPIQPGTCALLALFRRQLHPHQHPQLFPQQILHLQNTEKGWKPVIRFAINIAVCYGLAYGIAEPVMRWALSGASVTVQDNVAMLTGMCLFVGFNYLGQRLFAFREQDGDKAQG